MRYYEIDFIGNYSWNYGDADDVVAKQAFRSLLLVRLDEAVNHEVSQSMRQSWKEASLQRFQFQLHDSDTVCI